ncbi:MAG: mechanosensitive ion channel family protein [Burkholderiales bacterium]|nr:mechanosensitive ion channel family protein [Burkholderiales bacterium]
MHVNPATLSGALVYLALFVVVAWSATRVLGRVVQLSLARDVQHRFDATAVRFLLSLGRISIWIIALVFYAHLIPALRTMGTALLTGVSVVSIVFGIAAQSTLGNLVAGLGLLLYRPFRVGDRLQVMAPTGVETGTVESLTLGYTILATFDNRRIVLPNSSVSNQVIVNLSAVDPKVMAVVPISIGYAADIDKARAILLELASEHPDASGPFSCPLVNLGSSSVDFSLRAWCADAVAAWHFKVDLLEKAKKRFQEAGIEIPYAYTNVILSRAEEEGG